MSDQAREAAIVEAAIAIFCVFARTDDASARARFAKMQPMIREHWIREAEAAFRVFERWRKGMA